MSVNRIDEEFTNLIDRARSGFPEAIAEILARYGGLVRQIVRQQLHQRMRTQFDSMDFQQDVWASFFTGDLAGCRFDCPQALVRFLSEVTRNKVIEVYRQRMVLAKRNLEREQPLEQLHFARPAPEVAARNPSPSQLAIASERWEKLTDNRSPVHRRILELLLQGHTHEEITEKLGLGSKFVQRFLQTLKEDGSLR